MTTVFPFPDVRVRAVFISDVHLGFRGCQADYLNSFLDNIQCDHLYLVGDIIDVWNMKKGVYWPQSHSQVIRKILQLAKNGTQVMYIPGNHDEVFREYVGSELGGIKIEQNAVHTTMDGKRLLVMHGDEFDAVVRCSPLLAGMGSKCYDWLLKANVYVNGFRRRLGFPYWSLAGFLKHKVKNAVNYIVKFESAVVHMAKKQGVDGLICGHIHHAEISYIDDILYINDGDWVESCTALTEKMDGTLELVRWTEYLTIIKSEPVKTAIAA